MKAEIVAIGTELLLGDVVNGNAAWLGHQLAEIGIDVEQTAAVGDNIGRIVATLAAACERSDVVIATGGLGPTQDDLTREALALLLDVAIVRDGDIEAALRARYEAAGRPDFAANNLRMADYPAGAALLRNAAGTAPGLRLRVGERATIYALPGVPREMRDIFTASIRDELAERAGRGTVLLSRQLHTVGIWESEVAAALADLDAELAQAGNPTIAYLASEGQTLVRITAKASSLAAATALVDAVDVRARALLGDVVYGVDDDTIESVVHRLLDVARATVATAESLTGGLLGAALTTVPGSSTTYRGGVVVYATEAKADVLGVDASLLDARGPVDPDVAAAMAVAARARFGSTYGVATTGVAGPTQQNGVPVGTVHVALAGPRGGGVALDDFDGEAVWIRTLQLTGDRARIRQAAVRVGLDMIRRRLGGMPPEPSRPRASGRAT
ncbi:MAG: competence/damage-inducible protein A [Acidothermaceae bacterium]